MAFSITNQLLYQLSYAGEKEPRSLPYKGVANKLSLSGASRGTDFSARVSSASCRYHFYDRERVVTDNGSAVSRFLMTVLR